MANSPQYCIGIMDSAGGVGGIDGPTLALQEMLDTIPDVKTSKPIYLIELSATANKIIYQWNNKKDTWEDYGYVMKGLNAELLSKIMQCRLCKESSLSFNKLNVAKGHGKLTGFYKGNIAKRRAMLIGLNPSYRRFPNLRNAFGGDVQHKGSGWEFYKMLASIDAVDKVYITNMVKCSTESNAINETMFNNCKQYLLKEIEILNPSKIITLGDDVYKHLYNDESFSQEKDYLQKLYHPSYCVSYNKISRADYMKKLGELLNA